METVTVTVLRPGGRDQFGDPLSGTEHDIPGCIVGGRGSSESDDFANTVITGAQLLGPPGADIKSTDQVRLGTVVYEVEGDVWDWGVGVQVALQRATG